ncbi:MAG TPA: hypothetical protein VGL77_03560 [Armatimonadota bacterium]|jgi:hypothetical protein
MTRNKMTIIAVTLIVLVVGIFGVWPLVDGELMKVPFTDGITAVRAGNVAKLRNVFTADATVSNKLFGTLAVANVIDRLAPLITQAHEQPANFRFGSYTNMTKSWGRAEADFTIIFVMEGDEVPYHGLPVGQQGHVVLLRHGLFSWKIAQLSMKGLGGIVRHESQTPDL